MGTKRKPRVLNKHIYKDNDEMQDKDGASSSKSKISKRKLSDMLGCQWSKEELTIFYEAYRKYGKDWKKVAGAMHKRSADMVETLYNINKVYLSFPEGDATAAGFVAMMILHHDILDESGIEQKGNDVLKTPQKLQKLDHGKLRHDMLKGSDGPHPNHLQNHSALSCCGRMSLLRKNHSGDERRSRAVGKRTPRVRIQYFDDKTTKDSVILPNKEGVKSKVSSADGVHVAAVALAEASRGGSPQVSQTPSKAEHKRSSHYQLCERKHVESKVASINHMGIGLEKIDKEVFSRGARRMNTEGPGVYETHGKVNIQGERLKGPDTDYEQNGDIREACSGTEDVLLPVNTECEFETEVSEGKTVCYQVSRKRSRQLLSGGECPSLYALHTLADLAIRILSPASAVESDSRVYAKEQKGNVDFAYKTNVQIPRSENNRDPCLGEFQKNEVSIKEGKRSSVRQLVPLPKQGKFVQAPDCNSLTIALGTEAMDLSKSSQHISTVDKMGTRISRRKMSLRKAVVQKELKSSMGFADECSNKDSSSVINGEADMKEKLSHCLSSSLLRRWCIFEYFYSAIDYPWFNTHPFVAYIKHLRLSHVAAELCHVEWDIIKSALGRPRLFCDKFLREEMEKLEQYRESVRTHYAKLHTAIREGLPTDIARPLSVGQRVIVHHPERGEIHDGSILAVDRNSYMVQFDNTELGIEFVMDVDCMPLNPWENMPADLRKQNAIVDDLSNNCNSRTPEGCFRDLKTGDSLEIAPIESLKIADGKFLVTSSKYSRNTVMQQQKEALLQKSDEVSGEQKDEDLIGDSDSKKLSCMASSQICDLGEQEALLQKSDEVSGEQKDEDLIGDPDSKKLLCMASSQICDLGEQVDSHPLCLRQHNAYHGNSIPTRYSSTNISGLVGPRYPSNTYDLLNQESGSRVVEIVDHSRREAREMVDATFQAMSSLKEREDSFPRIGETFGSANHQDSAAYPGTSGIRYSAPCPDQESSILQTKGHVSSDEEAEILSELISGCVSTYLMIQTCAEGRFPPAEAAEILERAMASLRPRCSQNLPIYREVERCMGIIKSQMLMQVPTLSTAIPAEGSL